MDRDHQHIRRAELLERIRKGAPRALLLDYDGTLAPFRIERNQAVIDPRYLPPLRNILERGRTRVVIISGRAIDDLKPLVDLQPMPELWGSHGWERLLPDGTYIAPDLSEIQRDTLRRAMQWADDERLGERCEHKPAGVAIHWRGLSDSAIADLYTRTHGAWKELVSVNSGIEIHTFDGGLELRATGRDKGWAVKQILRDLPNQAVIAYAGDDTTDEDAFIALCGRGTGLLIRPESRPTAADVWLKAPDEWERFLRDWMTADREGGDV